MNKKPKENPGAGLGTLIEQLGPLNNRWRHGNPAEKVLTLWDMGDVILKLVPNPSDPLLWEIQEKSYITRSVLRYALIVRRGWKHRNILDDLVRGLRNYTVFREALPFLKGNREGIDDNTHSKVVSLLSSPNTREAIGYLKKLKAQKIGRQHKKGASVTGIREEVVNFMQALAQLESEVAHGLMKELPASPDTLVALSQIAMALATEEVIKNLPAAVKEAKERLPRLAGPLIVAAQGGRTSAAAFRKIVGAERLMQAADMLNSMRTEEALAEWRRRHAVKLSLGSLTTSTR